VHGAVAELLLQADQVARQQEIEDLPAPVAQGLVAKRPAFVQREQPPVGLLLMDQVLPACRVRALLRNDSMKASSSPDTAVKAPVLRSRQAAQGGGQATVTG